MINIQDTETQLADLLRRVLNGEEIIIAQAGLPIAVLAPIKQQTALRVPGNDADTVVIHANFDNPLPEFEFDS
ncbi:MAG: type II toxin-antitoxin system Phd/YefM family antitoxin [Anaerolineales bacterium]|nr:type II toxin-antitoxin system Phd/YefM family antitoxin [Anaerolineales bacterium]